MTTGRSVCRCGVYADLHPTKMCVAPRHSFWWNRHCIGQHIRASVWWSLSTKRRWWYADRYYAKHPELCWCDMVDALLAAESDRRADYEDICDVPLLSDSRIKTGNCYCSVRQVG